MVTWEQRSFEGDPRFAESQDVPNFDYAGHAEAIGLRGIRVDRPEAVGAAWDEALSADRPTLVEARVDAAVPPLPPHVSFRQASAMMCALLKGDADAPHVLKQAFRELVAPLLS
jgi:pyruvate dehydrogenase (quinone)